MVNVFLSTNLPLGASGSGIGQNILYILNVPAGIWIVSYQLRYYNATGTSSMTNMSACLIYSPMYTNYSPFNNGWNSCNTTQSISSGTATAATGTAIINATTTVNISLIDQSTWTGTGNLHIYGNNGATGNTQSYLQLVRIGLSLGSAPSSSTQLGYSYNDTVNRDITGQTVFGNYTYSPSTGVAGNYLTPGIYIASMYIFYYPSASSVVSTSAIYGISSNTGTNPNSGSTSIVSNNSGLTLSSTYNNTFVAFPSFVFYVATSGYYYSYATTATGSGSLTGSFGVGVKTMNIVRIG